MNFMCELFNKSAAGVRLYVRRFGYAAIVKRTVYKLQPSLYGRPLQCNPALRGQDIIHLASLG